MRSDCGRRNWYALQVRPRKEKQVYSALLTKGYDCLLPLGQSRRLTSSGVRHIQTALFSGYLFCHIDVCENRLPLLTTPDVLGLVGFRNGAVSIDSGEIEAIKKITESGLSVQPWSYIAPGRRVQLLAGPLSGLEGVVIEQTKATHLVVSVELLQRSIAVEIHSDWAYVGESCPATLTA